MGPLLFTIYVNDMVRSVNCALYMYADDAALVISGKNVSNIELSLSKNLESLSKWLEENKLSLHLGKTESILFGTHKKLAIRNDMNIQCKGIDIDSKPCVKYLGVNIDQDMSGTTIGSNYIKKINGKLKFLHRKVSFFRFEDRKMLSSALLQSHFDYACNFWFRNLNSNILHKFQTAQNKIIRYILQYSDRHHLEYSDFVKVKLLNVKHRVDYITLCHMYNVYNGSAPSYLCSMINSNVQTTTRSQASFILPHVKTQGKKSFKYNGIKLWNLLSIENRNIESRNDFKKRAKKCMFLNMKKEYENEFVYY